MNKKYTVGSAMSQISVAPPLSLEETICEVLYEHIKRNNNLFTSSIAARWLDVINHTKAEDIPSVIPKIFKSLLETVEETNQQLLKFHERSTSGPKIIIHKDSNFDFISDITKN